MFEKTVSKNPFLLEHCPDKYKSQKMYDKVVGDCPAALKFLPDWFLTSKMIKNFMLLNTQMMVYLFLINILVMSHFVVMK